MKNTLRIIYAVICIIGFFVFPFLGGGYNWIAFIFAALLLPLGVWDDMIKDYNKLIGRR